MTPIDECRHGDVLVCIYSGLYGQAGQFFEVVPENRFDLARNKYPLRLLKQMEYRGDRFDRVDDEKFSYLVYIWD